MKPSPNRGFRGWATAVLASLSFAMWSQDTVDVRLYGAEGQDLATAIWSDGQGVLLAGETTSDIAMAQGQALWAPGGPVGKKGFVAALDASLEFQWGFAFAGDPESPLGVPSAIRVEDVVRMPTGEAAVLHNAVVDGHWGAFVRVLGEEPWSPFALNIEGTVQQSSLTPAGQGTFLVSGSSVPAFAPAETPSGVFVGLWEGGTDALDVHFLSNTEGMLAKDAAWHQDTLYLAVDEPVEGASILVVTLINGTPVVVAKAPASDASLTFSSLDAGPLGLAWAGTVVSADGSLDAAFGKLGGPSGLDSSVWEMAWEAITLSEADRTARQIAWRNDVVRCTAQATNSGEGGTGILVQERSGETGAWFGAYTFGGEGGEDVAALALDASGRLLMAGSSNSWTDATNAALFRLPLGNLNGDFDYDVASLVQPDEAFVDVSHEEWPCLLPMPSDLQSGYAWESPSLRQWAFFDLQGRFLNGQESSRVTVPARTGYVVMVLKTNCGTLRKRVLIRP
jgi:hypothetical protein